MSKIEPPEIISIISDLRHLKMSDKWHLVPKPVNPDLPKAIHVPDLLIIKYDAKYNWRLGADNEYTKLIIPDFIKQKHIEVDIFNNGTITIQNITSIANENKTTVEQIGNTIKTNLIANMKSPERCNNDELNSEFKSLCFASVIAFSAALAIGLMVKLGNMF